MSFGQGGLRRAPGVRIVHSGLGSTRRRQARAHTARRKRRWLMIGGGALADRSRSAGIVADRRGQRAAAAAAPSDKPDGGCPRRPRTCRAGTAEPSFSDVSRRRPRRNPRDFISDRRGQAPLSAGHPLPAARADDRRAARTQRADRHHQGLRRRRPGRLGSVARPTTTATRSPRHLHQGRRRGDRRHRGLRHRRPRPPRSRTQDKANLVAAARRRRPRLLPRGRPAARRPTPTAATPTSRSPATPTARPSPPPTPRPGRSARTARPTRSARSPSAARTRRRRPPSSS